MPPKLAARVRLLATGNVNKNDPGDARSVAIAALRSAQVREARRDDHGAVLKVWSKRYRDLGRARTQVACRLHQVLCELIPGGVPGEITAGQAGQVLASITPAGAVQAARCELAAELTEDLRGAGIRIRETRKKLTEAVRAAGTSLTGLFGVGPVIAAAVIGDVRAVSRFASREGNRGTTLPPGRPAHTPSAGSSGQPLPGLPPTLRPLLPFPRRCHPARARGRVQDRAQPGRAAAPAGRPRRGRPRADNARSGKGGWRPGHTAAVQLEADSLHRY